MGVKTLFSGMEAGLESGLEFEPRIFDPEEHARTVLKSPNILASVIDHALLRPDATRDDVMTLCDQAAEFHFACVIVNPAWVAVAQAALAGTGIAVCATVGSPAGASLSTTKLEEALILIRLGARELETMVNIGWLKSGMNREVERDIHSVAEAAHDAGAIVKVILETSLLSIEEKLRVSELAIGAGADFLKNGTGLSQPGTSATDVAILRGIAGRRCGIKAAGKIRTLADVQAMLEAGADRIGTSTGVSILREAAARQG